jgi:anoctamin-1
VVIFVAAFPLAPVFALINNVFEMRLDAKKLLTHYRRPVSQRVKNIGVWYRILDSISKLSVITNGFIIAFTSDFIPRLIYTMKYGSNNQDIPYLNFTLSSFNITQFERAYVHKSAYEDVSVCYYQDFRHPHSSPDEYEPTTMYW